MSAESSDVIDLLAGLPADARLQAIRTQRPQARDNAQLSYAALFQPGDPGGMTLRERHAVAAFVAGLHQAPATADFYAAGLLECGGSDLQPAIADEVARGAAGGPYGRFPQGRLSAEDQPGPHYSVSARNVAALGQHLSAALAHAHMLVFHPRDAAAEDLQRLIDAGWSATDIVALSQLVAFLSFQIRVVAGLRSLAATPAGEP
jgi:CMD domain protein